MPFTYSLFAAVAGLALIAFLVLVVWLVAGFFGEPPEGRGGSRP